LQLTLLLLLAEHHSMTKNKVADYIITQENI
jgi:hypothetical protein